MRAQASEGFDITIGQAEGFEGALRAYIEDCQSGPLCPLTGDVDDGAARRPGRDGGARRRGGLGSSDAGTISPA